MGFIFLLLNFLSMPRANKSKSHLHNKNIINFKSISTAHYFCSRFGQNIKFNNIKHVPTTVDNVSFLYNKFWSHTSAKLTMRHHTTRHHMCVVAMVVRRPRPRTFTVFGACLSVTEQRLPITLYGTVHQPGPNTLF